VGDGEAMGALPLSKKDTPMRDLSKGKLAAGSSKPPAQARASGVVAKARESAVVGAESSQDLWMQVCLKCISLDAALDAALDASLLQPGHDRDRTCHDLLLALPLFRYLSTSFVFSLVLPRLRALGDEDEEAANHSKRAKGKVKRRRI
jgi:hypothetical protein